MSEDPFLARWSRLKRAEEARDAPPAAQAEPAPPEAPARDDPAALPALTEAEVAALPPIDTITAGVDVTGFLRRGVPAALRQAALRRVWRVNPAIRDHLDPARDYAYDWNAVGGAPAGPLSPEKAARLFERMLAPPVPAPTRPVAPPGAAAGANAAPALRDEDAPALRDEDARPALRDEDARPALRDEDARPALRDEDAPRPAQRRHGGATPV